MQYAGASPSFLDRVLDHLVRQPPQPSAPEPPKVDEGAWAKSVDQARISDNLTVHDLGLIVFNESQSYSDRKDSNEPIAIAREKMAHAIINADQEYGSQRQRKARTALPIEPPAKALNNSSVRAAYESSMQAAREAYLSGNDPTNGAIYLRQQGTPDRSNWKFTHGTTQGVPLSTLSGPYDNSYTKGQMPSSTAWLKTYQRK